METTVEKILALIKNRGISESKFLTDLGLGKDKLSEWKKGKTKSYKDYIVKIADYFNVSTDYLLGKDTSQKEITDSDLKFALFGDPEIDDEVLDDIKAAAKAIADRKKQKIGK